MISSKPQDGETIIEEQAGPLGEKKFIATRALLTFFDDLAKAGGSSAAADSLGVSAEISASFARLAAASRAEIEAAQSLIAELATQSGSIAYEIQNLKSRVTQLEATCL